MKWLCLLVIFFSFKGDAQVITTIAGNGVGGYNGDGGLATAAEIEEPIACAFDDYGNFYFSDIVHCVIRKIAPTGIITTIAGTGSCGYNGDGIPATNAQLSNPVGIVFDSVSNLYIADSYNNRVRKIDALTGVISTVVGNGVAGYFGDGGPSTAAQIKAGSNICIDKKGNMYVLDWGRIRKVNATGIITTIAGNGVPDDSGDGGMATAAHVQNMVGICLDKAGNIYFSQAGLRIRKITIATGLISKIAGVDSPGSVATGDGGQALLAALDPWQLVFDRSYNLYSAGYIYHNVRKIDHSNIISTVAGTGAAGYNGDDIPATAAKLNVPIGITVDSCGNLYIADRDDHRIRKITFNPSCIPAAVGAESKSTLSIYPNPAYDQLHIDGLRAPVAYRLLSMAGYAMQQGWVKAGDNVVNLQSFGAGIYLLELTDDDGQKTFTKITKQ